MPCFITSGVHSQKATVNGWPRSRIAGAGKVAGSSPVKRSAWPTLPGDQRVGRRGGAGLLGVGQVGELVVRLQLVERIVADQSRNVRLQVGAAEPGAEGVVARLLDLAQLRRQRLDLAGAGGQGPFLCGRRQRQRRRGAEGGAVVGAPLVDAVEEGAEAVVILHRERIVFVVVTAGAFHRQPEERGAEGVDAIGDVLVAPLLGDAAALVGHAVQPAEGGGQPLLRAWRRAAGRRPAAR